MAKYVILLGGDLRKTPRLMEQITGATVIAADGGMEHAKLLGVEPILWVGDFDSVTDKAKYQYRGKEICFNQDKDKTDGELAIDQAIGHGATELILCGSFGGDRVDHSLGHIALAFNLAKRGIKTLLTSGNIEAVALCSEEYPQSCSFTCPPATLFSLISFSDLEGLEIKGAKWNLDGKTTIKQGSTHTLSNVSEGEVQISLTKGKVLVLAPQINC